MVLDRTVGRNVEEFFRNKQGDKSHDLKIGFERFKFFPDFRFFVGVRLIDRKLGSERGVLERVGLGARAFRRDIDRDHVVAALEQCFEHCFAERLLTMNDNAH